MFAGSRCPWELVDSGTSIVLSSLANEAPPPASGVAPEVCAQRPCRFEGYSTGLGPFIVVTVSGASSEMPDGVWLGWTQGGVLGFVDAWEDAGPDEYSDATNLGPSHTLAPHQCGKQLALVPVARTNGGAEVEAPPSLMARAGVYDVTATGVNKSGEASGSCVPLPVPLP
jgi:hypothetical protein